MTNTGQLPLTDVTVTDDKCSPVDLRERRRELGQHARPDRDLDVHLHGELAKRHQPRARIGHDGDTKVSDDDDGDRHRPAARAGQIPRSASTRPLIHERREHGGDVTYTYVVTNTGNVSIFDINVRDDNGTPAYR